MKQNQRYTALLLVLIIAGAIGYHLAVLTADQVPPIYDQLGLTRASLVLGKGLATSNGELTDAFYRLTAASVFPPLIHYTALLTTLVSYGSLLAPIASFGLYIAVLILSTYSIARRMAGRTAALAAAAIVMMTPGLDGFSRIYMTDFPLAALTAAGCAMLFATQRLTRARYSIGLGALIGFGLLAKQTLPIYLAPPILVYAGVSLAREENPGDRRRQLVNLAMAAAVGFAIAATWYIPRLQSFVIDRLAVNEFYSRLEPERFDTFFYLDLLAHSGTGVLLFAATIVGAWAAGISRETASVLAGIVVPLLALPVIFTMSSPRYLLPVLPFCCVITAVGTARLFAKWAPYALAALILASAFGLYRHAVSVPAGPLDWRQMHQRFQEIGVPRPQFIDREAVDETVAAVGLWHREGRIVMLLDSPMTQAVQAYLWEKNLLLPIENVFEMAGVGKLPEGLTEKSEIAAYLADSRIIILAAGAPNGLDTYAPNGNIPGYYAERVFEALDEVRSSFGQVFQKKTADGVTIRVLAHVAEP